MTDFSKEQNSKEKNEFRKKVIRSIDLPRLRLAALVRTLTTNGTVYSLLSYDEPIALCIIMMIFEALT